MGDIQPKTLMTSSSVDSETTTAVASSPFDGAASSVERGHPDWTASSMWWLDVVVIVATFFLLVGCRLVLLCVLLRRSARGTGYLASRPADVQLECNDVFVSRLVLYKC